MYIHSTQKRRFNYIYLKLFCLLERVTKRRYSLECVNLSTEIENFFDLLQPRVSQVELVRLGKDDGSYVIPNDLEGIAHCISPGYGGLSSFEEDLFTRYGIPSTIIDKEITEQATPGVVFTKRFLDTFTNDHEENISIDNVVDSLGVPRDDLLLQLDIEGNEWLVLRSLSYDTLSRFRIVAIELHSLPLIRERFIYEKIFSPSLLKMLEIFDIVSYEVHKPSGFWTLDHKRWFPDTVIVTFHRKDRTSSKK